MPPGTPYNSFVLPYRIRVDDFGQSTTEDNAAALHLLTHTHSDHINGLSAQSFGYTVICSKDAKEMLLRHEVYAERELLELDIRAEKTRTYAHLKVDPRTQPDGTMYYAGSRDLLNTVSLDTPIQQELSDGEFVTITLLNANHCPGAVMFLIEGARGAILHTGDFRAEPWFLDSLTRHPSLQPYLAPRNPVTSSREPGKANPTIVKTLEAIYLDTASVLSRLSVPSKERATTGLVELMRLIPETAYFFINMWTWGYEDILKAIAREFGSQIHVDRYKFSIFQCISDPFLRAIVTRDSSSTRFHACERFHRCEYVAVDNKPGESYSNALSHLGKRVVYINPVTMGSASWNLYLQDTKERMLNGEVFNNLLVPLSRHSPLPELRDFVALFRPRRVVPNTLDPRLQGLDWRAINNMFADCLHPHVAFAEQPKDTLGVPNLHQLVEEVAGDMDVALKNLVGDGAADLAERWAESGKLRQKLEIVRAYLRPMENAVLDGLLGVEPTPPEEPGALRDVSLSRDVKGKGKANAVVRLIDSEDESDGGFSEDERGKTAHRLFASLAGIEETEHMWWVPSPASQRSGAWVLDELEAKKARSNKNPSPMPGGIGAGAPWAKKLTPISSPVRPSHRKRPSPLQMVLTPPKRRRHAAASTSSACTPPELRKGLFAEDRAFGSPIHFTSPRTHSYSIPHAFTVTHPGEQSTARPIASSSRLPLPAQQHPEPPVSPLLEVNNHLPKRTISPAPLLTQGTRTALKQKVSNTGRPVSHLSSGDENIASDKVSSPARIVGDSRWSPGPRQRPTAARSTPPNNHSSKMKEKNLRACNLRARRSKLNAHRLGIAERLAGARPDLVAPTYENKRATLLAREVKIQERARTNEMELQKDMMKAHLEATGTLLSIESVGNDDGGMDWGRSRMLAEAIKADVANGRRPILPPLICAESQ